MKFRRSHKGHFAFILEPTEKHLLFQVLQLYPLVPLSHQRLSKASEGPAHDENQRLLEEALNEQRRHNRNQVLALLNQPGRLRPSGDRFDLSLTPAEMESLLQVLNDVRIGAWLALGEPDEIDGIETTKTNAPYLMAMQAAGYFQSVLLAALGVENPPGIDED